VNTFAVIILVAIIGEYLLSLASSILSLRTFSPTLPAEFRDVFDEDKYAQARHYSKTRTYFGFIHSSVDLIILLTFWFSGGFEWFDQVVRTAGYGPLVSGLVYIGSLTLASSLLGLPFRLYSTFVIEARFGFNRTTVGTFASDLLKGLVLGVVLGGLLLAVVLLFFEWAGPLAWLWCWLAATAFMLAIQFVAPTWIMPIFNKFTALEDGELHDAIVNYTRSASFPLQGLFIVDGSRRSSKANAFFTGFGTNKRIGLFDTLVDDYSVQEVVAVVAHEVGHYKKQHIVKSMVLSVAHLGVMFWVLSFFLRQEALFAAFSVTEPSVYTGLLFFGLLFTPVELVLSVLLNVFSRKNEFEADEFSAMTTGDGESLVRALKKLSADNLSNLTPHPVDVFLHYSHPPVLERIRSLHKIDPETMTPA
jgi:STE24 endopeptidase